MQTRTDGGGDLGQEVEEGGRGFEFEGVGVKDGEGFVVDLRSEGLGGRGLERRLVWRERRGKEGRGGVGRGWERGEGICCVRVMGDAYLFVDGQKPNPGLTAFGKSLSIDLLVGSLAIEHDRLADNPLLREVVLVNAGLDLLGQLQEFEGLGWADDDGLVAFMGTFGKHDLRDGCISHVLLGWRNQGRQLLEALTFFSKVKLAEESSFNTCPNPPVFLTLAWMESPSKETSTGVASPLLSLAKCL